MRTTARSRISARRGLQPCDHFFSPSFPRLRNNAGGDPDNRVALFFLPLAAAALRAGLAEKFLRQFFPAGRALPKADHRRTASQALA